MYVACLHNPILPLHQGKERYQDFPYQLGFSTQSLQIPLSPSLASPQTHQKAKELGLSQLGCCLIEFDPIHEPESPTIMPRLGSRHGTSPFIWCAAIICAIISVAVIFGGIVIFVGYMVIHPRVPIISVSDAHLNLLKYDIVGVLQTEIRIVIRAENDNAKAHALFDKTEFKLIYEGKTIAYLRQDEFEVNKERSVYSEYTVQSYPIPLNPTMMQAIDYAVKQDVITFELKGGSKTRWRVGPLGSVKFDCSLSCDLRFRPSDHSYIPSPCTSAHKH